MPTQHAPSTPVPELDERYSAPGATATAWSEAERQLASGRVSWLSTVRPDGRPHVTPLLTVWLDGAAYLCTGPAERKARNLAANPACVITTGTAEWDDGLDVVVEGAAVRVVDHALLERLAAAWEDRYGVGWSFEVHDGAFHHPAGEAWVFEVRPATVFAFRKGEFSQTRYAFDGD